MMLHRWKFGAGLTLALLLSFSPAGWFVSEEAEGEMTDARLKALAAQINPDGYTSHEVCGSCHETIHESWSKSAHARSVTDPAFQAALKETLEHHPEKSKALCLSCHAPTTRWTHSENLEDPMVQEGVTCDFCHTVKSVDLSSPNERFEMKPGLVKYGPFDYAPSPAHETAFSILHRNKPTLCAGCHEYATATGFPALSTYTEWKESPYPDLGVSCQDCHMALVQGATARKDVKIRDTGTYEFVNLHHLVGGGSKGQLRRGLDLRIPKAEVRGNRGFVEVEIENVAAGHKVPTGLPSKQLVLTVRALAGKGESEKETYSKSVVYERRVMDDQGRIIRSDGDLFFLASREKSDTRIAPREKRVETFRFPLPSDSMKAEITLAYRYQTPGDGESQITIIAQETRELRRR